MDNETTNTSATDSIEENLAQAIISIIETTNSPAIQRAREVIAHRLAISGDIAPSRIPQPRNITEIGGYINLLTEYNEVDQRSRMIAAALGIAGPHVNLPQPGSLPPLAFAERSQIRPDGPQQATFPLSFVMRTDFISAFDTALDTITAMGGAVPILSNRHLLPVSGAPLPASSDAQLDLIGRLLTISPTAALRDHTTDPISLSRPAAGGTFQVMVRVIDDGAANAGTVPDLDWTSWECDNTQCTEVDSTDARFELTPIFNTAGWYQTTVPDDPTTINEPGNWNLWRNITGLVPGTTRFGSELQLLYSAEQIVASPVFDQLDFIWTGTEFAAE